MDDPLYVIGGIAVIVLLVAAPFIRRWARRKGADLGERAGRRFADDNLAKGAAAKERMVAGLGATIVIGAPPERAHAIVTEATRKGRDVRATPDGRFEILFGVDPAATVALDDRPEGTLVHLVDFREQHGQLLFAPFWDALRTRIEKVATAEGVATRPGPQLTHVRTPVPGDALHGTWALEG